MSTPAGPVQLKTSSSDYGTIASVVSVKGTNSLAVAWPSYTAKVSSAVVSPLYSAKMNGTSLYAVNPVVISISSYAAKALTTPAAPVPPKTSSSDFGPLASVIPVKGIQSSAIVLESYNAKVSSDIASQSYSAKMSGTSSYPVKPLIISTSSYGVKALATPAAVYNNANGTISSESTGNSTSYSPLQVAKNAAGKNISGGLALIGAGLVALMML